MAALLVPVAGENASGVTGAILEARVTVSEETSGVVAAVSRAEATVGAGVLSGVVSVRGAGVGVPGA